MFLRLNQQLNIEDLRNHGPEAVEKLRQLLACGAPAKPDPGRSAFYELEDGNKVFYIYLSPVNGKILLLATWLKDEQAAETKITARDQATSIMARRLAPAKNLCPNDCRGGGSTAANP
jgi:hypothetical protein